MKVRFYKILPRFRPVDIRDRSSLEIPRRAEKSLARSVPPALPLIGDRQFQDAGRCEPTPCSYLREATRRRVEDSSQYPPHPLAMLAGRDQGRYAYRPPPSKSSEAGHRDSAVKPAPPEPRKHRGSKQHRLCGLS